MKSWLNCGKNLTSMPSEIITPRAFLRDLKKLAKKYKSALNEFDKFRRQLENDERPGDKVPGVGYDVYKVRLPNPSAQRSKSGGFRVIYYVQMADRVILLTIYSKTQQVNISPQEIRQLVDEITSDDEE